MPRLSGEEAPLFRDPDAEETVSEQPEQSFLERLNTVAQEPLTPLTKVLLVAALVLLLLTSIFIGLFAGVQHKLNTERDKQPVPPSEPPATITTTATSTVTINPPGPTGKPEEPVCLTPSCIVLSASILSSLDASQDPCENFYQFANGGWLNAHPLPADKGSFGSFEALAQQNKQVIQHLLESESSTSSFTTSYDEQLLLKLRDFYSSCLNEDRLNAIGTEPLSHFVNTLRKLYTGNSTDITSNEEVPEDHKKIHGLTAALAFLHSRGVDALFSFDIEGDVGLDPNAMVLWFTQPPLGLPSKDYYEEAEVLDIYRSVIERLLLTVFEEQDDLVVNEPVLAIQEESNVWPPWPWPPWGDDDDKKPVNQSERAHKLAKKVLEFESQIASASLDLELLYGDPIGTYNPVPISNLTESLPQIHFPTYFSTFTPRAFPDRVIVTYPPYLASLSNILNQTSSDVVEAYLIVRAGLSLSPYLGTGTEAWQAQRTLLETLSGIKKGAVPDRAEFCIEQVESTLGFASGRYFVNQTFGGESREKGIEVITDIINAFKASLSHLEWMDEKSAQAAAEKADAIRVKVGFPLSPDTRDPESIAKYYSMVKIDQNKFFDNILSAVAGDKFRTWLQLGRRRDPEAWEMYPSTVNAYFNPPANEIVFPAGILQPPFFSKDWPGYLSYGAFGHVAAHELTHAFDSAGRLYNQEGRLSKWWTSRTEEGFKKKQDCIVKQYSEYTIDDGHGGKVHVNGNLTSGENIGDSGLIQAFRAWKAQFDTSQTAGNEYLLPGLNFTREQLFFISFARPWARSIKPAAAVQRIRTDPHSPTMYRVEGTLSNIPEFAEAFKCSPNAKLNPPQEKRCVFW